ncbi:MAG: GAF domain-containing protein [Planctomycetota bacterium]
MAQVLPVLETRRHQCVVVSTVDEARSVVARKRFDVVMVEGDAGDHEWMPLLSMVHKTSPATKTIVFAPCPSQTLVVDAVRAGATDFIDTDTAEVELVLMRLDAAIIRARIDQEKEDRLYRLKRICEELNIARREVTEQVDGLCEDLAAAYKDIGGQMSDVAMSTEFRTLVKQELDVEDLLRTSLEYLLTKTGATNAAVFLSDHQKNFGLGAYVNYDCPRETISVLLDHLCQAICPQMAGEEEIVEFSDAREFANWVGAEAEFLGDSQVIAYSCHHRGECLAVIVLFRNRQEPFDENLGRVVEVLRPIFAAQLANVISIHHRATPSWPDEACPDEQIDHDDYGFGLGGELAA